MKRTPMPRSAPMKRTGFKHKVLTPPAERAPRKSSRLNPRRKAATVAERRHMALVAQAGCIVCALFLRIEGTPAHVHHLKAGGGSKRASHYDTMPLCLEHHLGATGIHELGQDGFLATWGMSETDVLLHFKALMGFYDVGLHRPARAEGYRG